MKAAKYLSCIIFLFTTISLFSQHQSILIFDPNDVSTSFQSTLSQLTEDSVLVADTLDETIFNYDALFLFINYPYELSQSEGNKLISYTSENKPAYIFCGIFPAGIDTIAFWNHIGIDEMSGLLISVPIDTVFGVNGEFTDGVVIDTSFMSGLIPVVYGNVDSVLIGDADSWEVNTTFKSGYDSLNVIIDLYNLIDNYSFLQKVLEHFGLIPPNDIDVDLNVLGRFELYQNYPNPFNPSTKIKYSTPAVGTRDHVSVELKVYDVLGNEIATLVNEEKQPGTYEIGFEVMQLPSGIYFYQLKADNFIETKKMILMK